MFRIVKQPFGAHNRASAHKKPCPRPDGIFCFEMRNQSKPGFQGRSADLSMAGDVFHDIKNLVTDRIP